MSAVAAELASCRGVTVAYGAGEARVLALNHIDLDVRPGEQLALLGPSGSGKTTLLHVLGGLVTPNPGVMTWRAEPLSSIDASAREHDRTREIAFVFQGANLLPAFTAEENVAFAAEVSAAEATEMPEPAELLTLVGLEEKFDALPSELSGGEAQRVAIARALAQRPALLLCDEPTGHLDSDTGARVLDLIEALQHRFGFAQVVATHDPNVAARAERTITLADGRITGAVDQA